MTRDTQFNARHAAVAASIIFGEVIAVVLLAVLASTGTSSASDADSARAFLLGGNMPGHHSAIGALPVHYPSRFNRCTDGDLALAERWFDLDAAHDWAGATAVGERLLDLYWNCRSSLDDYRTANLISTMAVQGLGVVSESINARRYRDAVRLSALYERRFSGYRALILREQLPGDEALNYSAAMRYYDSLGKPGACPAFCASLKTCTRH